jgi:hypothetical protein
MWVEETSGLAAGGGLSREFNLDLEGRALEPWIRRALLTLLALFVLGGLMSLMGQTPTTIRSEGERGAVSLTTPPTLRGGLMFQTKITIEAGPSAPLHSPELVLSKGFLDGLTLNTLEPGPAEEESDADHLTLTFPRLDPGKATTVWIDYQVNPTTVGARTQELALLDDGDPVADVALPVEVLP